MRTKRWVPWSLTALFALLWYVATTQKEPNGDLTSPDLIVPFFVLMLAAGVWAIWNSTRRKQDSA